MSSYVQNVPEEQIENTFMNSGNAQKSLPWIIIPISCRFSEAKVERIIKFSDAEDGKILNRNTINTMTQLDHRPSMEKVNIQMESTKRT